MHGHVTLISCSPEAAAIIASGGRISTMDGTADEIYAKSLAAGQEKNEKLIGKTVPQELKHSLVSFGRFTLLICSICGIRSSTARYFSGSTLFCFRIQLTSPVHRSSCCSKVGSVLP